jgi:hypothetical protein
MYEMIVPSPPQVTRVSSGLFHPKRASTDGCGPLAGTKLAKA